MRKLLLLLCLMPLMSFAQLETDIDSPTEDVLTEAFVSEEVMTTFWVCLLVFRFM